jgi:C4-dicarboxylate-specific signal transduction histidine kinase
MPIALWQVDARLSGEAMDSLRKMGVSDIASYLAAHPELVEYACDAVYVTAVNDAAITLFGGSSEADLLKPVRYLFAETMSAAVRVMTAHFERRRNHIEEMKVRTIDGRILDILFLVTYPSPPEPQETTFISILDITDRLRVEAELRKLQADFAHAARVSTLGELVASIAHEVKQPLSAIVMNGETSLRWLSRKEPNLAKVGELAQRMVASASHASEIIQRIQSMAKKQDTVRIALDINEVVEEAIQFVRHESKEKRIDISLDLDGTLPPIEGDRIQLQQVVVNLLVNAIQAIDQAGSPKRTIVLRTSSAPNGVELTIRDTGPGIAEPDLQHVFTGFFTTRQGGMGMGLTICQSIICSHGGEIGASNHADGGASFRVFVPFLRQS